MKDFLTKNWGKTPIQIPSGGIEMKPSALHMKEDGDVNDGASFCFVLTLPEPDRPFVYGQISLAMLAEGMRELGYDLVKQPS